MKVVIYLLPASLLDMFSLSFDRNSAHSCHANLAFFSWVSLSYFFIIFVLSNPDKAGSPKFVVLAE